MRIALLPAMVLVLGACARTAVTAPTSSAPSPARLTTVDSLVVASPAAVGFDAALPARLDSVVRLGLDQGAAPGAALAVGLFGRHVYLKGIGTTDYAAGAPTVDAATMYDLASLTKVVATTTAAMILEEEGKLDVSRTVQSYLPEFNAPDKATITVRMLLTHRGGLEAFAPHWKDTRGRADYLAKINARPLANPPGTKMVYSDWDFILMQDIIERITGTTLDAFVDARVFRPLGM
jgi:CubicO group peptidase (beta-lactamase class C family)